MLCERCKIREANIRYTEVVGGVATEHNLCSHCAKEIDFGQYTGLAGLFDSEYPIGKLLSQLLGLGEGRQKEQSEEIAKDVYKRQVQLWRRFKGVRIGIWFGCVTFLLLAYSNLPAWAP